MAANAMFTFGYVCLLIVVLKCIFTTALTVQDCPGHDLLKRLLPHNEYALVEWREPYSVEGTLERTSGHRPPHYFRKGEHEVKYTFRDGTATMECVFRIIVVDPEETDITPPTVQCPEDQIASVDSATQSLRIWWEAPLYSDDSGFAEVVNTTIASGSLFDFGFTPVTITVKDAGNLTASCTFTVKIGLFGDTTAPTITNCPKDIVNTSPSGRSATVSWVPPNARDDVGIYRIQFQSHKPGDTFNEGTTQIRYFFEDSSGNEANCSFTILVLVDQLRPDIRNCPLEVIRSVSPGQVLVNVRWLEPTATDDSGDVRLRYASHRPGDKFGVGTENVTYEFVDDADNTAFCKFPVIVNAGDTSPPVIYGCPNDIIEEVPLGVESVSISWMPPMAIDNSGTVIRLNSTYAPDTSFNDGITTIEYWFTDLSDNHAVCRFSITVSIVDKIPPIVTSCPADFSLELPANGGPVFWGSPTATDNSGKVRLVSVTEESGSRFYAGNTTVTYIFADSSENAVTCSFVVTATSVGKEDSLVQNCPSDINITISEESSHVAVTWQEPIVHDFGMNLTKEQTHQPGELFPLGATRVEYNWPEMSSTCEFLVNVSGVKSEASQYIWIYIGVGGAVGLIVVIGCSAWITRKCSSDQ